MKALLEERYPTETVASLGRSWGSSDDIDFGVGAPVSKLELKMKRRH